MVDTTHFSIASFGTLIMCKKGDDTINLRHSWKKKIGTINLRKKK